MNIIATAKQDLIINNSTSYRSENEKIEILVNALRLVSQDEDIKIRSIFIPDNCEKYGFSEGYHNLGQMLHFLADMLEE